MLCVLNDSWKLACVLSVGFDVYTCCYLVLIPCATSVPCLMLGLGDDKSDEAAAVLKLL